MEQKPRILFISLNGHQKKYFQSLGNSLVSEYRVFQVHYAWANASSAFCASTELPGELNVTSEEINKIITFIKLKAQYRNVNWLQRFFSEEKVLVKQARAAISYFYDFITTNKIDVVCVWNGTLIPLASATLVAKKLNKKILYFENGYLPGTTTVDPTGVNNRSSLAGKPAAFYEAVEVDQVKLQEVYNCPPAMRALKNKWYQKLIKNNISGEPEQVILPEQFLLLPLQVHDDTQILLHSDLKTMEQFLDYVIPTVMQYNRQAGVNIAVVVKEHPSDFGRIDYQRLKEKYDRQHVLFLRFYPTPQLIDKALGIITINSSVGIEALLKHKPVITLGRALYNIPGLAVHVGSPEDLQNALDVVINQDVNHLLIDKFLFHLRYTYLAEGAWRCPSEEHFDSVKRKIAGLSNS